MIRSKIILSFLLFISLNVFSQNDKCPHCQKVIDNVITKSDSNSYEWNGNTYYVGGTYYYHTKNISGGDSICKLNLKIYNTQKISRLELQEVYKTSKVFKDSLEQLIDSLENCLNPSKKKSDKKIDGKYYALLIAVQDYAHENYLDLTPQPLEDAEKLQEVLENDYNFEVELLLDPVKDRILMVLEYYQEKLNSNDNLLIFYAGHGGHDKDLNDGYWCPSDATGAYYKNVNNDDIRNLIKKINSRNTLLIADACWSGTMNRSGTIIDTNNMHDIEKVIHYYTKKSRIYMSSGSMSTVPNKSIFLENLVLELKENKDKYLFSSTLFSRFHLRCAFSTDKSNGDVVTPERKILQGVNHDSGDFIFIKK